MKKLFQLLALSITCLSVLSAHADDSLTESPYLLGDWGGARTELAESGIALDVYHIFDVYDDFSGASRSGTAYFGRQRVAATFDLEKILGWDSAVFSISGVDQYGKNYNRSRFGVLTNPSSIEGADTTRLANIWLKQILFDGKLMYKVGKLDGVGEFGVQEFGGTFMNDELAYVPNAVFGSGLPFDPAQKLGLVLEYRPAATTDNDGPYLKAGVFDSNDSDAYRDDHNGLRFDWRGPAAYAGEIGYRSSAASKPLFVKVGMHYNTDDFADLSRPGTTVDNNTLVYLSAGKTLYNLDPDGNRHIDASFSYNYAPEDRNTYHHEVTALVRSMGPFDLRPHDELGIGFIAAFLSDDYSNVSVAAGGASADAEYTIELAYKALVSQGLILQPDFQVVIDPSGDDSRDPVWIAGLRTVVTF